MSRDERGSIAPAIPIIAMALLLLGGLGIDGSRQLNARGQAVAFAEEAARAGAQAQDPAFSGVAVDEGLARQRVADYCARVEQLGQVTSCRFVRLETGGPHDPRPLIVVTEVSTRINTTLLGMIGVHHMTAGATARARPYQGVDSAGDGVTGGQDPAPPDPTAAP